MLAHLLLTFRHRAGVRPYTSSCDFAEPCVFSKQSPPPGLCPRPRVASKAGLLLANLRRYFAEFLQCSSLKRLGMLYQSTCVGLGYDLMEGYFLEPSGSPPNPIRVNYAFDPSQSSWPGNINPVPIDYAFRPRLRGRLTLLRLALSRNPWTFGGRVSHPSLSLLMSTFSLLNAPPALTSRLHSKTRVSAPPEGAEETWIYGQNAPLPLFRVPSFGSWLEPRYIFAAGQLV